MMTGTFTSGPVGITGTSCLKQTNKKNIKNLWSESFQDNIMDSGNAGQWFWEMKVSKWGESYDCCILLF